MKFSDQSDEASSCIDCGKEVGLDCECEGPCHQCSEPTHSIVCGIRFCFAHRAQLMKANMKQRWCILKRLGFKKAA